MSKKFLDTIGFITESKFYTDDNGLITAGHCNATRGPGYAYVKDRRGHEHRIGFFGPEIENSMDTITGGPYRDYTIVRLDKGVPYTVRIDGRWQPTSNYTKAEIHNMIGRRVCKMGSMSGFTCGPIVSAGDSFFSVRTRDIEGDSGAPVFVPHADGTATALGIVHGYYLRDKGLMQVMYIEDIIHDSHDMPVAS